MTKKNKIECPQCGSDDLTITSTGEYICNECGYPNKIKYVDEYKEKYIINKSSL